MHVWVQIKRVQEVITFEMDKFGFTNEVIVLGLMYSIKAITFRTHHGNQKTKLPILVNTSRLWFF